MPDLLVAQAFEPAHLKDRAALLWQLADGCMETFFEVVVMQLFVGGVRSMLHSPV